MYMTAHTHLRCCALPPARLRPAQVGRSQAEKSVQIMAASSGGVIRDQEVANRYGKVVNPPKEWLYMGGGYGPQDALEGGDEGTSLGGLGSPRSAARPSSGNPAAARTSRPMLGSGSGAARPQSGVGALTGGIRGTAVAGRRALPTAAAAPAEPKPMASGFRPVYD